VFCCRLEEAQTAQRLVADDKEDLERQLQDIGQAKVDQSCAENDDFFLANLQYFSLFNIYASHCDCTWCTFTHSSIHFGQFCQFCDRT